MRIREALMEIGRFATVIEPTETVAVVVDDESDNRILSARRRRMPILS